jgi:hypothetical protein
VDPRARTASVELDLAEKAFADGLYEFVALQMTGLVAAPGEFPGRDRAELLLAESDYLCGRRDAAEERLRRFVTGRTGSSHQDEAQLWLGRVETEHRGKHENAERRLLMLYDRLTARTGVKPSLLDQVRYFLAYSLVEQGTPDALGDRTTVAPTRRPGRTALDLLDNHIRSGSVLLAEAHILRGRALYLVGRPDECHTLLQRDFLNAAEFATSPLRSHALFWQAEARYGQARWEEAAGLFSAAAADARRAGQETPDGRALAARAHFSRGWALMKRAEDLGRAGLTGSTDFLRTALEAFDSDLSAGGEALQASARLRSGEVLVLLGHHDDALARLEPLLSAVGKPGPLTIEARYLSALAHENSGRMREAQELLEKCMAVRESVPAHLRARIDSTLGRIYFQLAEQSGESEKLVAAAKCFEAIRLSDAPPPEQHWARLWMARILSRQGRTEDAVRITEDLNRNLPARATLRGDRLGYSRGSFLLELARKASNETARLKYATAAAECFAEAYSTGPRGEFAVPALLGAAEVNLMLGNDTESFRIFTDVRSHPLARPDDRHRASLGLARQMAAGHRYRKAAEFLDETILQSKEPPSPELLRQTLELSGSCLAAADAPGEAAKVYDRLSQTAADRLQAARAGIDKNIQLMRAGRPAEAATALAALASDSPAELKAEILFRAGLAHQAAADRAAALRLFVEASALTGDFQCDALILAAETALASGDSPSAESHARRAQSLCEPGDLRSARATLARASALMAAARLQEALGQFQLAAEATRGRRLSLQAGGDGITTHPPDRKRSALPPIQGVQQSVGGEPTIHDMELRALLGSGETLLGLGRPGDAAASFIAAAYLRDPARPDLSPPDPKLLERAAAALETAGQNSAAGQIRQLAAERGKR